MKPLYLCAAATLCLVLFPGSAAHTQTNWQRHSGNPLIPNTVGGGYALDPVVLFDTSSGVYRAWFTTKIYGGPWSIYHAVSFDGISWFYYSDNPVLRGGAAPFESDGVVYAGVVYHGGQYRMYYAGVSGCCGTAIGLAKSLDGIHWVKHGNNPVLRPSASGWDSAFLGSAEAVLNNNGTLFMYYEGYDGTYAQVGLATSTDGYTWVKHPSNPVLPRGGAGSWDEGYVSANGIFVHDGVYYLLYTGTRPGTAKKSMGLATSSNGVTWTKYAGNPVFVGESGNWDWTIHAGSPVLRGSLVEMWYSGNVEFGNQWSIGYAAAAFTPVGVHEGNTTVPLEFTLKPNYPNPFNPSTTIGFSLPAREFVTLKVYNILGQEIATLVSEERPAGDHRVLWSAEHQGSGVYFSRLTAGGRTETRKLILQR